jgi:ADP-L-glycero-D-manno-heptose 6-epimerase
MPEDIRDKYQYFTEANMNKLRSAGYSDPFYTLEEGVDEYVRYYLAKAAFL